MIIVIVEVEKSGSFYTVKGNDAFSLSWNQLKDEYKITDEVIKNIKENHSYTVRDVVTKPDGQTSDCTYILIAE